MSDSEQAYERGASAGYDEAERVSHDLPGQLEGIRRQARLLRDRLFATQVADPEAHLTARERAAASDH